MRSKLELPLRLAGDLRTAIWSGDVFSDRDPDKGLWIVIDIMNEMRLNELIRDQVDDDLCDLEGEAR